MNNLSKYIIEKLRINKDIDGFSSTKTWLKHCEQIIFNYLDDPERVRECEGEYEIEYSNTVLKVIFYEMRRFAVLSKFAAEIYKRLNAEGLIETEYVEDTDVKCLSNKWCILIYRYEQPK